MLVSYLVDKPGEQYVGGRKLIQLTLGVLSVCFFLLALSRLYLQLHWKSSVDLGIGLEAQG